MDGDYWDYGDYGNAGVPLLHPGEGIRAISA